MSGQQRHPRLLPRTRIKRFCGRGDLYGWLRTHHAEIEALRVTHRELWASLAAEAVEDGAVEGSAGARLRKRMAFAWRRIVRDVAAEIAEIDRLAGLRAAAAERARQPARAASDWRPLSSPPAPQPVQNTARTQRLTAPRPPPSPWPSPFAKRPALGDPYVFPTVDADGNALPEGMVFYRDRVMTLKVATELERADRALGDIGKY